MIRIKVCCIASLTEARMAVEAGASALGLVSAMPSGPGPIDDRTIAEIARWTPPGVASVLLTSRQSVSAIVAQHRSLRTSAVQIVDDLVDGDHRELREALPGIALIQVIHVVDEGSVDQALAIAAEVDALLLDSGNPQARVKELGGTGRVHDWELSRRIVDASPAPVFLAGGLTPDNVAEAIERVRPYGLDLCSGLRRDGRLDRGLLQAFFAAAHR